MAVPGRISDATSFGTNNLIRSGMARMVITARDIINDMDWESHCRRGGKEGAQDILPSELAPSEMTVMAVLNTNVTLDMSQLLSATGFTIGELMTALMNLELKGLIRTLPGQRYEKI
jgi:DNA processing protein